MHFNEIVYHKTQISKTINKIYNGQYFDWHDNGNLWEISYRENGYRMGGYKMWRDNGTRIIYRKYEI